MNLKSCKRKHYFTFSILFVYIKKILHWWPSLFTTITKILWIFKNTKFFENRDKFPTPILALPLTKGQLKKDFFAASLTSLGFYVCAFFF